MVVRVAGSPLALPDLVGTLPNSLLPIVVHRENLHLFAPLAAAMTR
jgi:hypothetical protein